METWREARTSGERRHGDERGNPWEARVVSVRMLGPLCLLAPEWVSEWVSDDSYFQGEVDELLEGLVPTRVKSRFRV